MFVRAVFTYIVCNIRHGLRMIDLGHPLKRRIYGRPAFLRSKRRGYAPSNKEWSEINAYYMLIESSEHKARIEWCLHWFWPNEPCEITQDASIDHICISATGMRMDEFTKKMSIASEVFKLRNVLTLEDLPIKWGITKKWIEWDRKAQKRGAPDRRLYVPEKLEVKKKITTWLPKFWLYSPVNWNICDLCGVIGHQRQVRERFDAVRWECDDYSLPDESRTLLCQKCFDKIYRLQKIKNQLDEAAKLNRKLNREVTRANKNEWATKAESC